MSRMLGVPPARLPRSWRVRAAAFLAVVLLGIIGIRVWLRGNAGDDARPASASPAPAQRAASSHWRSPRAASRDDEEVSASNPALREVQGRVVDASSGAPIEGAMLTLRSGVGEILETTQSSADGTFDFARV